MVLDKSNKDIIKSGLNNLANLNIGIVRGEQVNPGAEYITKLYVKSILLYL